LIAAVVAASLYFLRSLGRLPSSSKNSPNADLTVASGFNALPAKFSNIDDASSALPLPYAF
jgi:hypothetical protein